MTSSESKDRATQLRAALDLVNRLKTELEAEGWSVEIEDEHGRFLGPKFVITHVRRTKTEEL